MVNMHWNGILVTSSARQVLVEPDARYRGVAYGQTWPLSQIERTIASSLEFDLLDSIEKAMISHDAPWVLADLDLACKYVGLCEKRGVGTRVLLCGTTSEWPIMEPPVVETLLPCSRRLGYDYWDGDSTSPLNDDMNPVPFEPLECFASQLNEFGLFDTLEGLASYLTARESALEEYFRRYPFNENIPDAPIWHGGNNYPTDVREISVEDFMASSL
jgi:hypothetical protein